MEALDQSVDDILQNLSELGTDWMDDQAAAAMAKLSSLEPQAEYGRAELAGLLDGAFDVGILCARLFLGLSKDSMEGALRKALGTGGIGVTSYQRDREAYLDALEALGLPEAMQRAIHRKPVWSDILEERLRSGRGSAIQGQKRGRGLEDFAEALVREVFGEGGYEARCTFTGADGKKTAKCDLAVPDRHRPRIIIEVKGFGATGSKMTNVLGDLDAIIEAKRHDASLLLVTDGTTWAARLSDLKKIVERQNQGKILRIYTTRMREQLVQDLRALKRETGL